ncbi:MAG TPA: hypothetical protein VNT53_01590 [Pseudolysinimonas sp.]|nr:hypothetical protein [Pseudolysinimonas sp.]
MNTLGSEQLAWVESPLQLVCAAEYAAERYARAGQRTAVAFRLTGEQMSSTARELLDRGAHFSSCEPYVGIPWRLLTSHHSWIIGDAFSGQFRTAMSSLRARSVTVVDDGAISIHLARALVDEVDFVRPEQRESTLKVMLGARTRTRMRALSARGRAQLFTAFAAHPTMDRLQRTGFEVSENGFEWIRRTARPITLPHPRIVLGSAQVADRTLGAEDHVRWVAAHAAHAPISYLPHRREPVEVTRRIEAMHGVEVVRTGLPVELALAGTTVPLEVLATQSSAVTTLRTVLVGTGSSVHADVPNPGSERRVTA